MSNGRHGGGCCAAQAVGACTPGSNTKVEAADIRGVRSFGMLCSAYDLGWTDSPDGLVVDLPDTLAVGEAAPEVAPMVRCGAGQAHGPGLGVPMRPC